MSYIELETAIEILRKSHKSHAENYRDEVLLARDIRLLKEMPAADVVEVRHGEWMRSEKPYSHYQYKCSVCGCDDYTHTDRTGKFRKMKYCPNCGAKMDGERSENGKS